MSFGALHAQVSNKKVVFEREINPGAVIDEIKLLPPKTVGTYFINDKWQRGTITLLSNIKIESVPLKYDIENKRLEILVDDKIRICENRMINEFEWEDENGNISIFQHSRKLPITNISDDNLIYKVLYQSDKFKLLKETKITIKEADYIPALDMGNKDNTTVKSDVYSIYMNNFIKNFSSSKKKNHLIFDKHADVIEKFMKEKKLKYSVEEDLIAIAKFYNDLL